MSRSELVSWAVWGVRGGRRGASVLAMARDVLLVAAAGMAAGLIGPLLGRPFRSGLGMPLVGSLAGSLPRVVVLLLMVSRVRRGGTLTAAAVCEVLSRAALGIGGLGLTAGLAPLAAGVLGDTAWALCGKRSVGAWRRLAVSGAVLAGSRVLAAWVMLLVVPLGPSLRLPGVPAAVLIVVLNTVLGAAGGVVVAGFGLARGARKGKE